MHQGSEGGGGGTHIAENARANAKNRIQPCKKKNSQRPYGYMQNITPYYPS